MCVDLLLGFMSLTAVSRLVQQTYILSSCASGTASGGILTYIDVGSGNEGL